MDCFCAIWDFVTLAGIIKTIELGLTAFGCYVAWRALSTWREQIIDTPKIELAREIMESFYDMVDIIKSTRRNLISFSPDFIRKHYSNDTLTDNQTGYLYRLYLIDSNSEKINKFHYLKNKARTVFSEDLMQQFLEVIRIINRIDSALREKASKEFDEDKEYTKMLNETIFKQKNDEINQKLEQIIKEVEYNLKPLYASKIITWHKIKG